MPASPQVLLTPTGASSLIGATQQVTLSFSNAGTNAGYAPFIVLDLPPGADGYDGVTLISATYLGATVDTTIVTYDLAGNATNPLTGQIITGTPGAQAAILSLPFGSFSPGQTAADVLLTLDTDSFADNAAPLTLEAQGGFAFGNDPLNNPGADPVVLGPVNAVSITPVIALLEKTYLGPEQETATGPSYVRQWDVVGTIANGQTLSGYTITDTLPNGVVVNSAFTAAISTNLPATITVTAGALGTTIVTAVFTAPVIGGVDVPTLQIPFWVNQAGTGGGPILGATNGAFATLTNSANYTGNWDPLDPADPVTVVTGVIAETDTITAKSIAEQKGVTVVGGGLPTPGQTLEYTLAGQISDYFDIGTLVLTDTLGDGQTFQAGFTPVITLTENGVSVTQPLIASEYTVGPKVNGVTTITFDVSEATARLGFGATLAGTGEIAPNAATATVTFRATVDPSFTGTIPGDNMVDQGDTLANGIVFSGTTPSLDPIADDSAASVTLPTNQVSKSIAFINGAAVVGPQTIQAGDLITYHLRLDMPLTHTHSVTLHDFLPLPVFLATDPDANGVANGYTWNGALYDGMPPAVNNAEIGPNTTTPLGLINTPTITQNAGSNSLTFDFGSIIDGYMPSTLDLLFTVRVRDAVFGDGLLLTNQVTTGELNSQNAPFAANAIVQFTLGEPRLDITKGVVSTNGQGSFTGPTGPVVFTAPGVAGPAFFGTINSTNLAITPVDANLAVADGGDLVKFAIVVDNVGSGPRGAFDVLIRDTLPTGFVTPGGAGLNIRVTDGAGNLLAFTNVGGGLFDAAGGIRLTDPSLTQGALATDNALSGADIVVITYDLQVENAIQSPVVLTNVATVANYAAIEGGVNHTGNDGLPDSDAASVLISPPGIAKTVISTSAAHTGIAAGNATAPDLTIGELITWNVTVTIPEGVSRSVILRDVLPGAMGGGSPGLFELISVSNATLGAPGLIGVGLGLINGLTSPVVSDMNGDTFNDTVTFTLGDITNTPDGVVNAADTISFTLTARVKDLPANSGGLAGFNLAEVSVADPNNPGGRVTTQATSPFDIVEPNLSLTKVVNDATPSVGDTVTYTMVLTNLASSFSASSFDNLVQDALAGLPPTLTFQAGTVTAVNSGAYATSIVTGNVVGDSGVNVTTTRLDPGQTLTVTFQAVVNDLAAAGAVTSNTATAGGSTLPGTPIDERDYTVQATAQVVLDRPGITKAVFASSEPSTAGSSLAIGEIVTYRFTVSIPDGTSNSLTLIDDLPDAVGLGASGRLQFISAAVVSAGADLVGGALLLNPTVTATDFNGLNGSAERVTLNFGNVVNTPVNLIRGPQDQLVVELQARVIDVPANENGDTLINRVEIFANGLSGGTATAPVAIIVPELDIQKSTTFTTGDAGDVVTYTLSIGHTANSAATAFNLNIADTLPAGVMLVAGSLGTNFGTVAQAGNGITLTAASLALGGGPITVTYQARLVDAVFHNQSITNVANLAYTTLPGGGRALTDSDDATVGVRIIDTLDKTQVSTSLPATLGSDLAVGETVTYRLTATLDEGTQRLQLADALPAGLTYVSASVVSLGGGNITASLTGAPVFNGGTNSVSFDFGTVVNPGDNLENAGDQVVVEITARVNGTALPAGTTLTDTGTLTAQTPGGTAMPTLTDTVTNTVVAPLLNITKATPFVVGDAGDLATYTLTIAHEAGSTASAYNVTLSDLIPAGLVLVGVPTTTAGTLTTPGGNSIALSLTEYALGAPTITITYQARLADSVFNGQVIPNTATLNYASAPTNGTALSDTASDSVAVAIIDTLDKTQVSTSLPATLGSDLAVGETVTYRLTATLDEGTQQLQLADALPTGLTFVSASVVSLGGGNITASLTGAPVFNGGTNSVSFDFGTVVNPGDNLENAGDQVVVEITARVNGTALPAGTTLTDTGTLTAQTPGGMAMPTLTDTVTNTVVAPLLNITKATPFTVGDAGDVATYALTIAHEAGSTASAYNLVLNDLIPAGLTLVGVPTTTAGTLTTPGGNSIALSLSEYALGAPTITITYQARLANNVINGQVIPNTATLNYASAPTNGTALNDSASDSVAVAIVDSLAKSIASTSFPLTLGTGVGIGEIITYRLTATLAEGAQHLVLTDAMPAGLTFLSASVLSLGGGNITTALPGTPVFNGGTNTVSFDFGNIINPGDNLSNAGDQIVVEVVAQVAPGAMVGTNLINTGTLTPTLPSGTPFTGTPMVPVTSTQAVTVLPTSTINGVVGLDALFFCCGTQATAVFEGVTVNLLDQLGNIISSTLTDVNGAYSIPATIGGIYDIQFVAPSGLVFAPVGSPGLLGVVNDASAAGLVDDITVTPGPVNGIDAGLLYSPIVGLTGNAPTYLPNGGGVFNFDAPGAYAIGGTGGGYTLNGNGAQPYLVGGTGNNILHGGNGNGSILVGGPGQNIFEGTPGADIILFCCGGGNGQGLGGNGQGLGVSGGLFNGNACFNFDLMVGGSSRDIIEGNDGNVVALGGAGNDEIHARGLIVGGTNTGTITSLGGGNFGNLLIGDTIKISNGPTRVVYQQGDGVQFVENFIPSRGDTIEIYGFGAPTATGIFNGWGVLYFGPNQALVINGWQPQNGPLAGLNYFAGQTSMSGAFGRFNPLPPVVLPTSQTSFYGTQGDDIAIGSAVGTTFRGNGGNDLLVGGNAADIFFGGAGNDSFYGGGGNDQFNLGAGSDQVSGCDGTDVAILAINQAQATIVNNADGSVTVITPTGTHVLTGVEYLRFNDATVNISGVAQPPLLLGTAGADVFNVTNAGTIILDTTAGDDDQAYVSVNGWTASPYIEIARLTGAATIITGNDTGMQIVANPAFASNLTGGAGADVFWGSNNNGEVMSGGGGDDVFRSGTGTTTMFGGTGNDQFVINNAASIVIENAGEGVDTAWVNVNGWTMGAHVEIGRLSGTATMLTGNNTGGDLVANALLGSTIVGGSMATTFWGGSGTDNFTGGAGDDIFRSGTGITTMTGGLGNDQYVINNAADVVIEAPGGGTDTMWVNVNGVTLAANVEIGRLAGTATQLTGSATSNQLVANPGLGSTLVAGTGTTALWGGTGADTMVSSTTNQQMYLYGGADVIRITGPWGIDEVADFSGIWGDGDRVNFQGSGITGIGQLVITDFGDKTLVQSGASQLILYGVGSLTNTLTAGDFIF